MTDLASLYQQIDQLITEVRQEGNARSAIWDRQIHRPEFRDSAHNLACYLALRHRDLCALQRPLMQLGLSSLGRLESRVLPGLLAVRGALAALAGRPVEKPVPARQFFAGEEHLKQRSHEIFGPSSPARPVTLLVTCPSAAADDPSFMVELAIRGVEAIRINCAHDDPERWQKMIDNARAAGQSTGRQLKVLMDLAGPKIRTAAILMPQGDTLNRGDRLAIIPAGQLEALTGTLDSEQLHFAVECTLPEILHSASPGQRLFIDDGKLGAVIEQVEDWGLVAKVASAPAKGLTLKPEKGLNFPDMDLQVPALTGKDLADLQFVAQKADGVGFSFVQSAADVQMLQEALARHRPADWQQLALILKIETPCGVRNLPDILVQSAGNQPTAIMIARGDLAVEIGFARLAEMQEEILWLGEAAQIPVIWATQVLERLIQKGRPSRGEMTDAAMAARAECVMLNKGPYLLEAIAELDTLLGRMEANQYKKTPRLRRLQSW